MLARAYWLGSFVWDNPLTRRAFNTGKNVYRYFYPHLKAKLIFSLDTIAIKNQPADEKQYVEPLGQRAFLDSMIKFTGLTSQPMMMAIQEACDGGLCLELAIVNTAMAETSRAMLSGWEAIIYIVSRWDGKPESLEQPPKFPLVKQNDIALKYYFELAIDYVFSIIPDGLIENFGIKGLSHYNLLDPNKKHFEMVSAYHKIQTIQEWFNVAGHFSKAQLRNILKPQHFQGGMSLVTNGRHAIRIGYIDHDQWAIYDPNYHHNQSPIITKILSLEKLIDEIIDIQSYAVAFTVAYLHQPKVKNTLEEVYEEMLRDSLLQLIEGNGLAIIARRAPKYIPVIFKAAKDHKQISNAVAQALVRDTHTKLMPSALKQVARSEPNYFQEAYQLMLQADGGYDLLKSYLNKRTLQHYDAFIDLIIYGKNNIKSILNCVAELKADGDEIIAKSLHSTNSDTGKNGLYILYLFAKEFLLDVTQKISTLPHGYQHLITALEQPLIDNDSKPVTQTPCIELLISSNNELFDKVITVILQNLTIEKIRYILNHAAFCLQVNISYPGKITSALLDFQRQSKANRVAVDALLNNQKNPSNTPTKILKDLKIEKVTHLDVAQEKKPDPKPMPIATDVMTRSKARRLNLRL